MYVNATEIGAGWLDRGGERGTCHGEHQWPPFWHPGLQSTKPPTGWSSAGSGVYVDRCWNGPGLNISEMAPELAR